MSSTPERLPGRRAPAPAVTARWSHARRARRRDSPSCHGMGWSLPGLTSPPAGARPVRRGVRGGARRDQRRGDGRSGPTSSGPSGGGPRQAGGRPADGWTAAGRPLSLVLDTGAFIAVERSDRDVVALVKRELLAERGTSDQRRRRRPDLAGGSRAPSGRRAASRRGRRPAVGRRPRPAGGSAARSKRRDGGDRLGSRVPGRRRRRASHRRSGRPARPGSSGRRTPRPSSPCETAWRSLERGAVVARVDADRGPARSGHHAGAI